MVIPLAKLFRVAGAHVDLFGYSLPLELNRLALRAIIVLLALFAPRGVVGIFQRARGPGSASSPATGHRCILKLLGHLLP